MELVRLRVRKLVALVTALVALVCGIAVGIAGAVGVPVTQFVVPYTSYTYDFWGEAVPAPQAYLPTRFIRGTDLGVGAFRDPRDIHVSPEGNVYIADTGNNRVVVLDQEWRVIRVIETFDHEGQEDRFSQPRGLHVTSDESLYVADTGNGRIVQFDRDGQFVRVIGPPTSDLPGVFSAGFTYRPLKVGVDQYGRIFVISQNLFEGLISFSQDGQFRGFVGAPRVTPNFVDYIWSRLATKEQRAQMQVFLPTEYTNLDLDPQGFIYATVIDREDADDGGQRHDRVKLLNAKGEDLLRRIGFHPPIGDVQFPSRWSNATRRSSSTLDDVTVHELGVYSVLDSNRGRVFTYDSNGNLLFVFGYRGEDHGQVMQPVALTHMGKNMLVLDAQQRGILLFEPTDYALLIWAALDAYHRGNYAETEAIWRKVLERNANYDLAYTGIGRSLLRREEYAEAMYYFKLGNNRREYSEAFDLYRRGVIYEHFGTAALVILAAGVLVGVVRRRVRPGRVVYASSVEVASSEFDYMPRKQTATRRPLVDSLRYAFYVIFHPSEGFLQLKGRPGAFSAATIILIGLIGTYVAARQYTGFIFNTADLTRLNLFMEIMSVLVPFALWCVVNWALTTLMDGKGTLKDIYIATAYALLPIILVRVPMIVASNYITMEEGSFYHFFNVLSTLWAGVLVVFGAVMMTHEYDVSKAVWTCIFTVAGMAFVMFLALLSINLSEQVVMFVDQIITEMLYRT